MYLLVNSNKYGIYRRTSNTLAGHLVPMAMLVLSWFTILPDIGGTSAES
jgi:hypothetical protein